MTDDLNDLPDLDIAARLEGRAGLSLTAIRDLAQMLAASDEARAALDELVRRFAARMGREVAR
jgi:hypothetical protein